MPTSSPSGFKVDADSDPVGVRVHGRASFHNSACLQEFLNTLIRSGRSRFAIDFKECASMDSTFLGVLAGAALQLRKLPERGSLVLCRLSGRNLELVRNLGLDRLLTIDPGIQPPLADEEGSPLLCTPKLSELEQARLVLQAHEDLVAADANNQDRFKDVLAFLKEQVKQQQ